LRAKQEISLSRWEFVKSRTNPAPVRQAARFELVINNRTAK
jgi:hypothetical protein